MVADLWTFLVVSSCPLHNFQRAIYKIYYLIKSYVYLEFFSRNLVLSFTVIVNIHVNITVVASMCPTIDTQMIENVRKPIICELI